MKSPVGASADVTLVIPLRDEQHAVPALVASIERQVRAPDAVIFVDGGSIDDTVALVRTACARHAGWRLIEAGPATPGRGRNVGFEAASTAWVALTDAGVDLDPHWLDRLTRMVAADPDVEIVYGHYEPAIDGFFTACAALAYVAPAGSTGQGPMRPPFIASCLVTRDLWARAGGFPDLRAAEDMLFLRRVRELGARVALAPEAIATWDLQPDLRRTFRRFRTYSKVNVRIGEERSWHYGVARMYLAAAPFVLLGAARRRSWLFVPLMGLVARAGRSVSERREGRGLLWATNPLRVGSVAAILLTIDAATFAGWAVAIVERRQGD